MCGRCPRDNVGEELTGDNPALHEGGDGEREPGGNLSESEDGTEEPSEEDGEELGSGWLAQDGCVDVVCAGGVNEIMSEKSSRVRTRPCRKVVMESPNREGTCQGAKMER